jgi:hypothetical protein
MNDSRFWRVIAALAVGGLFYVGHGLHAGRGGRADLFAETARAGGIAMQPIGGSQTDLRPIQPYNFFTAGEDGRSVYAWWYGRTEENKWELRNVARMAVQAEAADGGQVPEQPAK